MKGLMMDYQLNVPAILRRGEELFGPQEIVSRLPDKSWHRTTYADVVARTKQLALALRNELGLVDGDRVGTFAWNHHEHLETYIGAPAGGFVTHTLNLRLHADDLTYIASHGGDRVLIADKVLWPLVEQFKDRVGFEHIVAIGPGPTPDGAIDYEELLATQRAEDFAYRDIDERAAAAMCYTSGTTGKPKGVAYSHRAIAVHALTAGSLLGMTCDDVCLPVVPMFHANAWCFPFSSILVGVKHVYPGPHLDPASLLDAFESERVTVSAGVPTIWNGILQALDANPGGWDLSSMRTMTVGGAAPPRAMIEAFGERHGLHITHGWGMTEMCPIGTISGAPGQETGLAPRRRTTSAPCRAPRSLSWRSEPEAIRASSRGTARRWASSRCVAPRSPPPTTTRPGARTAGRMTAGSAPETSSRSTPTRMWRSRIAPRISSSRVVSGSRPSHSRTPSWGTPPSSKPR